MMPRSPFRPALAALGLAWCAFTPVRAEDASNEADADTVLLQAQFHENEVIGRDIRTTKELTLHMAFPGARKPKDVVVRTKQIEVTEDTVLGFEPGRKLKLRRRYVNKRHQWDDPIVGLRRRTTSTLHGAVALVEASGKAWNEVAVRIEQGEPSKEEIATVLLDNYAFALLPGRRVKVGESWERGIEDLREIWGGEMREIREGRGKVTFEGIVQHEGAPHAKIRCEVIVKGIDIDYDVEITLTHDGYAYFDLEKKKLSHVDMPGAVTLKGSIQGIPTEGSGEIRVTMRPAVVGEGDDSQQ